MEARGGQARPEGRGQSRTHGGSGASRFGRPPSELGSRNRVSVFVQRD